MDDATPAAPPAIGAVIAPVTPLQQNCTIVWCNKTKKAAIIGQVIVIATMAYAWQVGVHSYAEV